MKDNKINAWDLFEKTFKENDEIFVISEYDEIYWGKFKYGANGIESDHFFLTQLDGSIKTLFWLGIRFISHDGFPIQKLKGADGSISIETVDTKDIQKAIVSLATQSLCPICKKLVSAGLVNYYRRPRVLNKNNRHVKVCHKCHNDIMGINLPKGYSLVFGDPFLVENVSVQVFNPGNNGPVFWGNHPFEESLLLSAKDGARALLYDSKSIYYLGA